jgi:uncharacterized protein
LSLADQLARDVAWPVTCLTRPDCAAQLDLDGRPTDTLRAVATRLIDPTLFTDDGGVPQLVGSRSESSGVVVFPRAEYCPKTAAKDMVDEVLPTTGTLWSWTIQGFRPKSPPYTGPDECVSYGVGYIDLGVVKVESRLTVSTPEELAIGMDMHMVMIPWSVDADGTEVLTYAFAPVLGADA